MPDLGERAGEGNLRNCQLCEPGASQGKLFRPHQLRARRERRRTGRNIQLNIKVCAETIERFYAISDRHGWVLGETFERAIAALERSSTN